MTETSEVATVSVPAARLQRWTDNFFVRHGGPVDEAADGPRTWARDGSWFEVRSCFDDRALDTADGLPASVPLPSSWGVLLVRKGGFAVARLSGAEQLSSKVGRRHVQGRSKAGGQSQQRFSRRRDNQARAAYEACADHAAQHLAEVKGPVLTGGDEQAVREVFTDPRLRSLRRGLHFGDVVEPRRDTLDAFVARCLGWQVSVHNESDDTTPS